MIAAASPIRRLITAADTFSLDLSSLNALAVLMSCCATNLRSPMILRWCCAVPISAKGKYCRWVCTTGPACTDQLVL